MTAAERPWSVAGAARRGRRESGRHVSSRRARRRARRSRGPAGVDAVERLTATFDLTRRGRDGLHVEGRVSATVRQTCVVSLEPMVNTIDEAVEVDFCPARVTMQRAAPTKSSSTPGADEEPEPLVGNTVDLGLLATEFLILGVDPYPRKPGAAFEAPAVRRCGRATRSRRSPRWSKKGTVKE